MGKTPQRPLARFVALGRLGLMAPQLAALRQQGYLQADGRGGTMPGYWRLRYRVEGKTKTAYVGADARFVEQVRRELAALQAPLRERRQLARMTRQAKQAYRSVKRQLVPVLAGLGYRYHGDVIRKSRRGPS
jgi:hypothetical protein